jgi:hypothetical protein
MAWGVVRVEAGVGHEPPAGVAGDVGGAALQHQMDLQPGGDLGVQLLQEGDEVGRGVAVQVGGGEAPAAVDIQGGRQHRGAVADVLVLLAGGPTGTHRRGGSGPAARGHAGRLVHAEHQGIGGRTRYSPQMSAARSQNLGSSGRVIQLRTRGGLMSRSARIRPTWEAEMPMSANALASWGGSWVTVATIRSR